MLFKLPKWQRKQKIPPHKWLLSLNPHTLPSSRIWVHIKSFNLDYTAHGCTCSCCAKRWVSYGIAESQQEHKAVCAEVAFISNQSVNHCLREGNALWECTGDRYLRETNANPSSSWDASLPTQSTGQAELATLRYFTREDEILAFKWQNSLFGDQGTSVHMDSINPTISKGIKKTRKKQQCPSPPRGCRNSELLTTLMPLSSLTTILASQNEDEPLQQHLQFKRMTIFLPDKTILALCSGMGKGHQNTWCYQQWRPSTHGSDLSETDGHEETCWAGCSVGGADGRDACALNVIN